MPDLFLQASFSLPAAPLSLLFLFPQLFARTPSQLLLELLVLKHLDFCKDRFSDRHFHKIL